MVKKHRYAGEFYRAVNRVGSGALAVQCDTIDDMREAIDDANARAFVNGYKTQQYIITHTEWYKYVDDDGRFVKREEIESFVEVYPDYNI